MVIGMPVRLRRADLVEPALSYQIVGVLFRVHSAVGPGLQEKHYQRAVATALRDAQLSFREQVNLPLMFGGKSIGRYVLDFLIEERVILEIKRGDFCSPDHIAQIKRYLEVLKLPLGILANFGSQRVVYRRILNIQTP